MKKGAELRPLDIPSCDRKSLKFGKAMLVNLIHSALRQEVLYAAYQCACGGHGETG